MNCKVLFSVIILFQSYSSISQKYILETFDSKEFITGWNISTTGELKQTNNYFYNNVSYNKPSLDSFLVIKDTFGLASFRFSVYKKFKVIPARSITFYVKLFSGDTIFDKLRCGYTLYNRAGKQIFYQEATSRPSHYLPGILGSPGFQLPDYSDSIWQMADSMEISFRFNPARLDTIVSRMAIIDGVSLSSPIAHFYAGKPSGIDIFPNPVSEILHIKFSNGIVPIQINLIDLYGRELTLFKNITSSELNLNVENYKAGLYFLHFYLNDGRILSKKICFRN